MAASDAVISKAGPDTIMEAVAMRRPLGITGAVGIQETGNIDFAVNNRLGYFCPDPRQGCRIINNQSANGDFAYAARRRLAPHRQDYLPPACGVCRTKPRRTCRDRPLPGRVACLGHEKGDTATGGISFCFISSQGRPARPAGPSRGKGPGCPSSWPPRGRGSRG